MSKQYTYEQIANDYNLWGEYVDTAAAVSEDEFEQMTTEEKVEMQIEMFGADEKEEDAR
jgi:hypothetical protein